MSATASSSRFAPVYQFWSAVGLLLWGLTWLPFEVLWRVGIAGVSVTWSVTLRGALAWLARLRWSTGVSGRFSCSSWQCWGNANLTFASAIVQGDVVA
jgi:hypothetical protein